jgi:hypothetical protein
VRDGRPPILWLRSFDDDGEVIAQTTMSDLADHSVESRLADHFARFGPFVAVANPEGRVRHIGAVRETLGVDTWPQEVLGRIVNAQLVVLTAGNTTAVNLELRMILDFGHVEKLIILLPEDGISRRRRMQGAEARLKQLRIAVKGTPWVDALGSVSPAIHLRAVILQPGGKIVTIVSRSPNRESYQLAALIGHFVRITEAPSKTMREFAPWWSGPFAAN